MYTFKGKAFISSTNIVQKLLSVTNIPCERMNMIFFSKTTHLNFHRRWVIDSPLLHFIKKCLINKNNSVHLNDFQGTRTYCCKSHHIWIREIKQAKQDKD